MKLNKYLIVVLLLVVPQGYIKPACDARLKKEINTQFVDKTIFTKLFALYDDVLNPNISGAKRSETWKSIKSFIECLKYKYSFSVRKKDSLDIDSKVKDLDSTRNFLKNDIDQVYTKKNLKELLNPLAIEQKKVQTILNQALVAFDKNTPSKKYDPKKIMAEYKKFYNDLIKYASSNSLRPAESLSKPKLIMFLQSEKILPQGDVKSPEFKAKVIGFGKKLERLIFALEGNTSFLDKLPFSGGKAERERQMAVFSQAVQFLRGYGFTSENEIALFQAQQKLVSVPSSIQKLFTTPPSLMPKLFSLEQYDPDFDDGSFLLIAESLGLYNALQKLIDFIQKNKK